jgi:hypothetical protein
MSKHKIPKAIERLDAKCYTCDDIETNCADLVVPHAKISWNIVDCLCTAVIGTTGTYFTLLDCEGILSSIESCQESWNCINGNCIDPGNGLGMYTTLLACQSECNVPPSWNCVDGNCIDPGNGLGTYTTLSACQSECKPREVSTWVLTGGGDLPCICEEIAGTSGQYTNEIDCLEALALDPDCCGTICSQLPTIPGPPDGHCRKYRQYTQGLGPNPATEVANILNITTAEAEYLLDTCCDCNPSSTGETTPTGWPVGVDCDKGIDAIFLVDYTSSMSSAVSAVKTGITSTVTTIASLMSSASSYRLALVIADEGGAALPSYQNSPYYNTLPSAQRVIVPNALASRHQYYTAMEKFATNNLSSFQIRVNSLDTGPLPGMQMGDGMNYPEPTDVLLGMCIEGGNFAGAFRSNVAKYVFIYTDVPPSGVDDQFTFHDVNRLAALKAVCLANGIKVMVLGNGVNAKHYPGGVNTGPFIYPWRELATGTGGDFHTSYSATTLNALITNGCK